MTINDVYESALYLAEKTNDATGYIDSEYKNQHRKKAEFLIKQAIRKFAHLENKKIIDPDFYMEEDDIPLENYILKNIIPCYVAAMLCGFDRENDKYNLLIYEYERMVNSYKHNEEVMDTETIKSSGCGITSAAMIISNLTDTYVEPPEMAEYSVKNGFRIDGVGTALALYPAIAKKYNLKCTESYNIFKASECVRNGGMVVCSTNGGENKLFSTGGHLFLMTGISGNDCEFVDPDNYQGKFSTEYRKKRCYVKNGKIYVNINEAKKHIAVYYLFERKEQMANKYSYDNTVEHLIRLGITDKENMQYWEKTLAGKEPLNKDNVRAIFDRLIERAYK